MKSGAEILTECDGLKREEGAKVLSQLVPGLRVWQGGPTDPDAMAFLVAATWNRLDREALDNYLALRGVRMLALYDWFATLPEVQQATGYRGPGFQSPILVVYGSQPWQGEGYAAREHLKLMRAMAEGQP